MFQVLKSENRGNADHGWLKSRHTFSFADYYNPAYMNFRTLRVINEDRIVGGTGFGKHGHRDMEIISYVVSGSLLHEDSTGNKAIIRPGEVQRMSAGTGVLHSEYNESSDNIAHFFQIWVTPNKTGAPFSYGQKSFKEDIENKDMVLVISENGRDGSIGINQDADLYISKLKKGHPVDFKMRPDRHVWIQMIKGAVTVNGEKIETGDGLRTSDAQLLKIAAVDDSEFILFDLA
ncbi:MAG: pirin family protein [Bacteriovorax sp.]|nr:pirin family protein [Bacteriovorax sp.]